MAAFISFIFGKGEKSMKSKTLNHVGAWCKEQLPAILSGAAVIGVVIAGALSYNWNSDQWLR